MKNILIMMVFVFLAVMPIITNATPECSTTEAGIPNEIGEPACYTSVTSTTSWTTEEFDYWTCEWKDTGGRYCKGIHPNGTAYQWTSYSGRCNSWETMYWAAEVQNTCGGGKVCGNQNEQHEGEGWGENTKTVHHSSEITEYTCHYLVVDIWGPCAPETGIQSAEGIDYETVTITQAQASGDHCVSLNDATTRNCGVCDSTTDGQGTAIEPTGTLCAFGIAYPVPPVLNGTMWEWECLGADSTTSSDTVVDGVTSYSDDVICSAPNEENGECNSIHDNATWTEVPPTEELCTGGTFEAVNGFETASSGPWAWNCNPIGANTEHTTKNCNANCFDFTTQVNPNPFPWPTNGDPVTVNVSVNATGMCKAEFTCTTPDGAETFDAVGGSTEISGIEQGTSQINIPVECTKNATDPIDPGNGTDESCMNSPCEDTIQISGYCAAKACNAQGTCQSTPITSNSYNDSKCTTSCNSNADCSSGRLIETQP